MQCKNSGYFCSVRSADVKQRGEQLGVDALRGKRVALRQNADRIMTVQAFLVAGYDTEITDAGVRLQLLAEQTRRIFDKYRVGGVQLGKGLFIFAFDHHLGFSGHRTAGRLDQVFEPQAILIAIHIHRYTRHGPL